MKFGYFPVYIIHLEICIKLLLVCQIKIYLSIVSPSHLTSPRHWQDWSRLPRLLDYSRTWQTYRKTDLHSLHKSPEWYIEYPHSRCSHHRVANRMCFFQMVSLLQNILLDSFRHQYALVLIFAPKILGYSFIMPRDYLLV